MGLGGYIGGIGAGQAMQYLSRGERKRSLAPLRDFRPSGFASGGFNFRFDSDRNQFIGGSTEERLNLLRQGSSLFQEQAAEVKGLRSLVTPGFSQFRKSLEETQAARLGAFGAERERGIGDVRENLSRRRVLGSSFGQDALSRTRAEFAQQEDQLRAQIGQEKAATYLEELNQTRSLMQEEFELSRSAVNLFLQNLNAEAGIAAQLGSQATSVLSSNAQLQSQLLAGYANQLMGSTTQFMLQGPQHEHEVGMKFLDFGMGAMGGGGGG